MSYNDLIYQKHNIPRQNSQSAGINEKAQAQMFESGANAVKDIANATVQFYTMMQDMDANDKAIEKNMQDQANFSELKVKYQIDPMNPKFKKEAEDLFNSTTLKAMENVGPLVKGNYESKYKTQYNVIQKDLDEWQYKQSLTIGKTKFEEHNKLINNQGYDLGRSGNVAESVNIFNAFMPDLEKNYKLIYGDFGFEDFKKAIYSDYTSNVISGLIETNPTQAQALTTQMRNNGVLDGVIADKFNEIAGSRIIEIEKWNDTKQSIAGGQLFRNQLNKVLDGESSIMEINNFIENNPKLSRNQQQYLMSAQNGVDKEEDKAKKSKAKLNDLDKTKRFNELQNMYSFAIGSDGDKVKENIDNFSKLLEDSIQDGYINVGDYKNFDEKLKNFENSVLETRYQQDYTRDAAWWGQTKPTEIINNNLKDILKPIVKDKGIDNYDDFVKTDTTAIYLRNYMYTNVDSYQKQIINEKLNETNKYRKQDKQLTIEAFTKDLNRHDIANIQDLAIQKTKEAYLKQKVGMTEQQINEQGGVNNSISNFVQMNTFKKNQETQLKETRQVINSKYGYNASIDLSNFDLSY